MKLIDESKKNDHYNDEKQQRDNCSGTIMCLSIYVQCIIMFVMRKLTYNVCSFLSIYLYMLVHIPITSFLSMFSLREKGRKRGNGKLMVGQNPFHCYRHL